MKNKLKVKTASLALLLSSSTVVASTPAIPVEDKVRAFEEFLSDKDLEKEAMEMGLSQHDLFIVTRSECCG
ncbi:MAG: hypothetical protein CMP10_05205 [Zetaproteobacteria bacterium]|nr:hypothetical protein [Pseudobdellovibrionaceae bacterium]|tara:strand:- start:205 stop:417 length:213 start_codon:yes stop_codon:yes gene_type:complete